MDGNFTVKFNQKVTPEENDLAAMILHIAKNQPEIVANKEIIKCSALHFPGKTAARFCSADANAPMVTIPPRDFVDILTRLSDAELVFTFEYDDGVQEIATAPYLPIILFDDKDDPYFMFTKTPQCYLGDAEVDGEKVRLLKPYDEMYTFFHECLENNKNHPKRKLKRSQKDRRRKK